MDIRNVQKTGNMFYVYLPTSWCKQFHIKAGSKVSTNQRNDGSLSISPNIEEREMKQLNLKLPGHDQSVINKLIVACYLNPLKSFSIKLEKELDINKLLLQKKLLPIELVEFDGKHITCESSMTADDPLSLLKTMIRKIKNLLYVMKKNYNKELIERYEEEIDKSNLHISKAVIGMLTHNKPTKYKIIELHYMGNLAKDLERLVDHLKDVPKTEIKFISAIEKVIEILDSVVITANEVPHEKATEFAREADHIPFQDVKNPLSYHKVRVKASLESISETLMNWSITEELYKTK